VAHPTGSIASAPYNVAISNPPIPQYGIILSRYKIVNPPPRVLVKGEPAVTQDKWREIVDDGTLSVRAFKSEIKIP
jgi:hypothetical protein